MLESLIVELEKLRLTANWSQLLVIAAIVVITYSISCLLIKNRNDEGGYKDYVFRLLFPTLALFSFLIVSAILKTTGYPSNLVYLGVTLSLTMIVIRSVVFLLRRAIPKARELKTLEGVIVTIMWGIAALYIVGWLEPTIKAIEGVGFKIGTQKITLLWLTKIAITLSVSLLIASWLSLAIGKQLSKRQNMTIRMRLAVSKTSKVVIVVLVVLIALDTIGVDITTLTVMGGALGVGIGLGLQRIASNFISGFILLYDRSIRPGDVITIGKSFGWIQEFRARYVVIRDRDGVDTLIPNENLITSQVINWSYNDRSVRQKLGLLISYGDNLTLAMKIMIDATKQCARVNSSPEPVCRVMDFEDHGIKLEVRYWISDPEEGVNNIRSDIAVNIWESFQEHGITIPFPQRDIHIKEMPASIQPNG